MKLYTPFESRVRGMFLLCLTPALNLTLSTTTQIQGKLSLDKAWKNFADNATRYRSLLDEESIKSHEVDTQYVTQEIGKLQYDQKIEEYTVISATHFNEQVSQDFAKFGIVSLARSLRSASSRASLRFSEASARLPDTKTAAAKAALAAKETERKRKSSIEIEVFKTFRME